MSIATVTKKPTVKSRAKAANAKKKAQAAVKKPPVAKPSDRKAIYIPMPNTKMARVELVGDSNLVCNCFSKKARDEMEAKQMGKAKPKVNRDPEKDFAESLYSIPGKKDKYGIPAVAAKAALATAANRYFDVHKVRMNGIVWVEGADCQDLLTISTKPVMRRDYVRNSGIGRTADLRYRGDFGPDWKTTVIVKYMSDFIDLETIIAAFTWAGLCVGLLEWRSEKGGQWGTFHVGEVTELSGSYVASWAK